MKRIAHFLIAPLLAAGCDYKQAQVGSSGLPGNNAVSATATTSPLNDVPVSNEQNSVNKPTPLAFTGFDFENRSYPLGPGVKVQLKNGANEQREGIGGVVHHLESVNYFDITGDGSDDAIVQLSQVVCGGSCDGGSALFFFYSGDRNKPVFLWRLETGSLGYGCGLKSMAVNKRQVLLETFNTCQRAGSGLRRLDDERPMTGGKFRAVTFTKFQFDYQESKFVLSKREVLPNPNEDINGHKSQIQIGNQ